MQNKLIEDQALLHGGEKIVLELDNCEIKENSYYKDTTNRGVSRFDIADSGYREQYIEQSVIIYNHKKDGSEEKFTSQAFTLNSASLESHILNKEVILYVDRLERTKYLFVFQPTNS